MGESKSKIIVETKINAKLNVVWNCWTQPEHIVNWNFASDDWCCPSAINEPIVNQEFNWRMEAKDGSMGFDFIGKYTEVKDQQYLAYTLGDGRLVEIQLQEMTDHVHLTESFEAENSNADEMQKAGWQAILNNFKKYVESKIN